MPEQTSDIIIIGGGIVGLATAYAFQCMGHGLRVHVLEKEPAVARHQSGNNSGVIHSGIYYAPGTDRSNLCLRGNKSMVEFCREHGVKHDVCGKIIVATRDKEIPRLQALYERGRCHGLTVKMLDANEIHEFEPNAQGLAAIHVPSAGIADYPGVCRKLAELIKENGGEVVCGEKVAAIENDRDSVNVRTSNHGYTARMLVNCAGLHSDKIAAMAGVRSTLRILPFRGTYFGLQGAAVMKVRNMIYPVPDPTFPFLGVHFTRGVDGSMHVGPNAALAFAREGYHWNNVNMQDVFNTITFPGFWRLLPRIGRTAIREIWRAQVKTSFISEAQRLVPGISGADLVAAGAGVRAMAVGQDGSLVDDFRFATTNSAVHVLNAPSPAATASLEIGKKVAALSAEILNRKNPSTTPATK